MEPNGPTFVLLDEAQQQALRVDASAGNTPNRFHRSVGSEGPPRTNFRRQAPSTTSQGTVQSSGSGTASIHHGSTTFSHGSGRIPVESAVDTFLTRLTPERNSSGSLDVQPNQHLYSGSGTSLRLSVKQNFIGLVLGLAIGLLCAYFGVSKSFSNWLNLPGKLFLRALNCIVVPYVFCCVGVAIGDIVYVGKVSVVGKQTAKVFAIFWVASVSWGMAFALFFRPFFKASTSFEATLTNAVGLVCPNGLMLQTLSNGSIACTSNATTPAGTHQFTVRDLNTVFVKNTNTVLADLTLSEQLIKILDSIVPSNIFLSMENRNLLSTITFATIFGAIAGRMFFTKTRNINYLFLVLLQCRNTFALCMEWVIWFSPAAVVFMVGGAFAANQNSVHKFDDVYLLVIVNLLALLTQFACLLPLIVFLMTRCNPYKIMSHMTNAYLFAFGVNSSLATAPVTLKCVQKSRMCSPSLGNFVISIGAAANLTAVSVYCPIQMVYLAESSGHGDQITVIRLIIIYFLSMLACVGTPPVPSSGLVVMATMYKTVFGVTDLPSTWALYVAMDIFLSRVSAVCNVNDDVMALKIIAENTDETVLSEHLGERD